MAVSVHVGEIASPAATGSQSYTGVGFQPKALIFWGAPETTANDVYANTAEIMIGAATDPDEEWAFAAIGTDGTTSSSTKSVRIVDGCIVQSDTASIRYRANLTALGADGFTLNWSATAGAGRRIFYMAIGGDEILSAKAGTFVLPTTGTSLATTDPGFEPDGLLIVNADGIAAATVSAHVGIGIGATDGTSQACVQVTTEDAAAVADCYRTQVATQLTRGVNRASGVQDWAAAFASFDPTGFTLSISDNPGVAITHGYLAIRGAIVKVGVETQPTSPSSKATTGLGLTPSGVLFASFGEAETTSIIAHDVLSIGAYDGSDIRGYWQMDTDAADPMVGAHGPSAANALIFATAAATGSSSTTNALGAPTSLDADGFTVNWTSADATARQFFYFALGVATAAEVASGSILVGDPADRDLILIS